MIDTKQTAKIIDIPAGEYFADHSAWSQSMLKDFADRRRLAHAYYVECTASKPEPKTQAKLKINKGSALHTALLEPHRFDRLVVRWPEGMLSDDGGIRTKEAKAFRDEQAAAGRIVLKDEQFESIRCMSESVKRVCGEWLEMPSRKEHSIYWTDNDTGLPMKMRFDILIIGNTPVVFDLKSTGDASPAAFKRICETLNYGIQHWQYTDGVEAVMGIAPRFYFIAIEDSFPFATAIYELDEASSRRERDYRRKLIKDVKDCIDTGNWADPFEERINTLSLRPRFTENE